MSRPCHKPFPQNGFTLPELMIAMAITIVIMVILFQVFAAASTQWQQSDHRTDAFRDSRAALQLMNRDLARAHLQGDGQMLQLRDVQGSYAREAYAVSPMANSGRSLLCAVGYYCKWNGTTKTYTLKRLFRDSNATIPFLATAAPNFNALYAKDDAKEEDLAAYAWDLQFVPGAAENAVDPASPTTGWDWIEVRFKCISPAAAAKLRTMNVAETDWANVNSPIYRNNILPAQQQFVTRVHLKQAP